MLTGLPAEYKGLIEIATLTVQTIVLAGLFPTYAAAAAGGDEFANNGKTFFHCKNGGGTDITVDHDQAVIVSAGFDKMIGPFPTARFDNASARVAVSYSAVTSVTVAAITV